MKAITQRLWGCTGLLAAFVLGGATAARAQNSAPITSDTSTTLGIYQQEQWALIQDWETLVSQGATEDQIAAWRQQVAARLQAQQQRAQTLATASALQPMPAVTTIPANAPDALNAFLTTHAALANARAQIHNQLLQSMPAGATAAQVGAMRQQEEQTFQQQYAGELALHAQQAQALANATAPQPLPVPGPPVIPPNAPPRLRAYITARTALLSAYAQTWNQYLNADPATRQAAMQQWQQSNAAQIKTLKQLTQDLSTENQ